MEVSLYGWPPVWQNSNQQLLNGKIVNLLGWLKICHTKSLFFVTGTWCIVVHMKAGRWEKTWIKSNLISWFWRMRMRKDLKKNATLNKYWTLKKELWKNLFINQICYQSIVDLDSKFSTFQHLTVFTVLHRDIDK